MADLIQVAITLDSDQADAVIERLFRAGIQGVELMDSETDKMMGSQTEIRVYHPAHVVDEILKTYASLLPDEHVLTVNEVGGTWRQSLGQAAVTLGRGFSINDHANRYPERTTFLIDLGSGFGDGLHQTTQLCVTAIETLAEHVTDSFTALDVGTGSGLLALVAASMGSHVTAIDVEDIARLACRDNAQRNGLAHRIRVSEQPPPGYQSDLVVANLYYNTLFEMAPRLHRWTKPGGRCVISGFTTDGVKPLITHFEHMGFEVDNLHTHDDWCALLFIKSLTAEGGNS